VRRILTGDLLSAARAVAAYPPELRAGVAGQMIAEAHAAHRYFKRLHRLHPKWGNGSLMARALTEIAHGGDLGDRDILDGLGVVAASLAARKDKRIVDGSGTVVFCNYVLKAGKQDRRCGMAETRFKVATVDPVWQRVCDEAREAIAAEPLLGGLVHSSLLHHSSMERALAYRFSLKLASGEMSEQILREIADEAYASEPDLGAVARADLTAVFDRDPACHRYLQPLLFFKGYQAVQAYRVGHWLWQTGRKDLAYFVQMRVSEVFGVDIHPAARIGRGIMIDHAHSIVIGETAVVGDNVSMLHSVTLGGTGKEDGDRHPKIGNGVLIGAGAKVLGNIHIGHCTRIAAGSVVLHDVPPCKTVAGVPARIVGEAGCDQPAVSMDHTFDD
jgi:serine O-acetyltransferase